MPITTTGELIGWAQERIPCSGINDLLMVSSLVLEENGKRIAIVTLDLLAVDFAEADAIRTRVASAIGVQPEEVLVAASHTHSGPASIDICSMGKNQELSNEIIQKADHCARDAANSLANASVRTAFTAFSNNANRRKRNWLGRTVIGVNLKGPVDQQLSCASIENTHSKILIVCYGCHPVINATSIESADYVAGIRQAASSAGFTGVLFLTGALGDVNPYDRESHTSLVGAGIAPALDFGRRIGQSALSALSRGEVDPTPQIVSASSTLDVSLPSFQGKDLSRSLIVQSFAFGRFALVSFPGEIFAQSSVDLRRMTSSGNLAVISCANGYVGYIPPRVEYAKGGYEILGAPRLLGYRVPAGLAEELQSIAARLIMSRPQGQMIVTSDSGQSS
jgi:neutral ceramidase